jgi:hypothetical protein
VGKAHRRSCLLVAFWDALGFPIELFHRSGARQESFSSVLVQAQLWIDRDCLSFTHWEIPSGVQQHEINSACLSGCFAAMRCGYIPTVYRAPQRSWVCWLRCMLWRELCFPTRWFALLGLVLACPSVTIYEQV